MIGTAAGDDAEMIGLVRDLFAHQAPPCLEELSRLNVRLGEIRDVVAKKLKLDAARAAGVSTVEARAAFGRKLPKSIEDFPEVEHRYTQLANQLSLILYAITKAVAETTPGNALKAAMPLIDGQISPPAETTDSAGSGESP